MLAGGAAAYHEDLGARWFGWTAPDPRTEPGQVAPPPGLHLPKAAAAPAVADKAADGTPDAAKIAAALAPYLTAKATGSRMSVEVATLDGKSVYAHGPAVIMPASTTKLLTTTVALDVLGPDHTFRTTTRLSANHSRLVLVGGGDPFLASTPASSRASYPHRADLVTLARQTARKLRVEGVRRIRLSCDTSLFTGPSVNPTWPSTYLSESVVPPITALWADEGANASGYGFSANPALTAAQLFAADLAKDGIRVVGVPAAQRAPAGSTEVAAVTSPPLSEIVERTLKVSDNNAAEVLAHQVGLAVRKQASYAGGVSATETVLQRLGIPTAGLQLFDGSGLSRRDRIPLATLVAVLATDSSAAHPSLRGVLAGLPVAGLDGSLEYRFDETPAYALGRVRAKTGTLTGVHALAGLATDRDGDQLIFVVAANGVPAAKEFLAQHDVDELAAALASCHCGQ